MECLFSHAEELSEACAERVAGHYDVKPRLQRPVGAKFRATVQARRTASSSAASETTASNSLRAAKKRSAKVSVAKAKRGRGQGRMMKACREDAETLCPEVEPGEGRIRACLEENASVLSPACA